MSKSKLPERASIEYLRKLAKGRLQELRRTEPRAKLAAAQLAVARDHGFTSWRALKAEIERRLAQSVAPFFEACSKGDVETLRGLLADDPSLVRVADPAVQYGGWTGLHLAAREGHLDAVRLLLEHGADPSAREAGDNTYPLHWAAAGRHLEVVRALLDAGGDIHGLGDVHELGAIGWATFFHARGGAPGDHLEVASLLVERGARHHIFSAMSAGDLVLIRNVVEEDPKMLDRRMSRFEQGQTPLHFAMNQKRYDILDLLIELGADVEAKDGHGQTALAVAMLRGDTEAMRTLKAAGAEEPQIMQGANFSKDMSVAARSAKKTVPMFFVPDMRATVLWYQSIGFTVDDQYEDGGELVFAKLSFGCGEFALSPGGSPGPRDVSLWLFVDRIEEFYELFKKRQLGVAQAALAGDAGTEGEVRFEEDLYEPFYGGRQFSIRDNNGLSLVFWQPEKS
jgi:ankyrin repeat protein